MADPILGDFSVRAVRYSVEKGIIRFPVKGVAVAGNLLTLPNRVQGVGNDLVIYGLFGGSSLRLAAIHVAGSKELRDRNR